jgi:hypothetical protein
MYSQERGVVRTFPQRSLQHAAAKLAELLCVVPLDAGGVGLPGTPRIGLAPRVSTATPSSSGAPRPGGG